jgi:hypothetical protein
MPKTRTAPTKREQAQELKVLKQTTIIEFRALRLLAALGYNTTAKQQQVRERLLMLRTRSRFR